MTEQERWNEASRRLDEALSKFSDLAEQLKHAMDRLDALELRTAGMGQRPVPKDPPDPNLDLLKRGMTTMFKSITGADYAFDGAKDGAAVKRLSKMGEVPAVLARWRACLMMQRFPATRSIAVFSSRFNEFAPAAPRHEPASPSRPSEAAGRVDPYANRGRARW